MKKSTAKYLITFFLLLGYLVTIAQDHKSLKKQFEFAQKTSDWFEGFQKSTGGNDFSYHSLRNDVNESMITRCLKGDMAIEWETQKIPEDYRGKTASFVWIAALDLTVNKNNFEVFINDDKRFVIISGATTDWIIENEDGGKLEYAAFSRDQYGDTHGYMSLVVPKKWFNPGEAIKIRMVGEAAGETTWIIVYKTSDVIPYLKMASKYESWMDVICEKRNNTYTFSVDGPLQLIKKTLHCKIGSTTNKLKLKAKNGTAKGSFKVSASSGKNLIILDGNEKLVDVPDFTKASTNQTILSKSILLNEVILDKQTYSIKTHRIYSPKTVKRMLDLAESNLGNGTIYLMNSSHQDIAWMDSPENCRIERDTMLITPLIEAALKNPDYRFDIEDALMLKEYIQRHPEKEETIRQLLKEGKISCGSTYIQPYEEMYSGEALARQFYFGAKWLKDKFDYTADTYWNVDVPGRTLQMPQIMKKAGTQFLIVSRHEKGIFKWHSPDGSYVLTYSPGHYGDAYTPLHKNFYAAAEYIASSAMDWNAYFMDRKEQNIMPLLSDWDMSPATDYSHIIKQWESINQLETEAGKMIEARLPRFKIATGSEFMHEFEKEADAIPSIQGERPAVWLYIHGPSHQKAIKASREADILLPAAEKYATMDALAKHSFSDYPQQRLSNAWEAKIYPDHGWGGKNGQITDDLFSKKFEFARDEASIMIENATNSLASAIKANPEKGIPIVVFNSLSWDRNDIVCTTLKFEKGAAFGVLLNDNNKTISHQIEKTAHFEDGSIRSTDISFIAGKVPSLGYKTFYVLPLKTNSEKENLFQENNYENQFYRIEFADGGLSSIFDKELNIELLNTEKFKGGEIFTMQSEGNGAGEFDNVQQPTMDGFDKTSNYQTIWENICSGDVYSSFRFKQQIRNAIVEQTITIYNQVKKIDFDVSLLNWEGILYREYRMAIPLNMNNGQVAYEVPFGVVEVGKDEIKGAAGERYNTPAVDIHPRGIENWIGANNTQFGVTFSSSVVAADYLDPTDNPADYTILQPILLASRRSCHGEGNEYLQTGNHYFLIQE